jgi:inner membrane protein
MERSLGFKLGAIVTLIVFILIGLWWIGSIVTERQNRRDAVVNDIAQSSSLAQRLEGPILVVPYEKTVKESGVDPQTGRPRLIDSVVKGELMFLPEVFNLDGDIPTQRRARGIYEARLYHANLHIRTSFEVPAHFGVGEDVAAYHFGTPSIALGITDIRGIETTAKVLFNNAPARVLAGTSSSLLSSGLHVPLESLDSDRAAPVEFDMDLGLQGTGEFHVIPVGRDSRIALRSNWANPSFIGQYLPTSHDITASGFKAEWATSFFSTNLEETLHRCAISNAACQEFNSREFGVSFIDPVDQYLKTERAIKYALLFISLTFGGFFLFEVLRKLAVHPIQYGLVGAALALFYLLLLSLSEHVGFGLAYLLSSGACVSLIGFYVGSILRSGLRGLAFASALIMLYGTLYTLVGADDYALLMGSTLLFGLLAAVMILTRQVNWFALGQREEESNVRA